MNLFRLSNDPIEAAQLNQDLHVRKILLEATQLLANCFSKDQLKLAPYTQAGTVRAYSYIHHPISHYVKATRGNYNWALQHSLALCNEFRYRFNKPHFCEGFIQWAANNNPEMVKEGGETEFPQCFKQYPECHVAGNPVAGYKNYYKKAKKSFDMRGKTVEATWTKREVPTFMR